MPPGYCPEAEVVPLGDGRLTFTGGPPKHVWHSTEGRTIADAMSAYVKGGGINGHATAGMDGGRARLLQHVGTGFASYALRNLAGGAQTNRDHAIQLEIVATADKRKRGMPGWLYIEDLPDELVELLGRWVRFVAAEAGVVPVSTVTWREYPHAGDAQRLSGPAWDAYGGHLGHQHVPENDHGDPGLLPLGRILDAAGVPPASTPLERIMAVAIEPVSSVPRWVDGKPAGGYVFGRRGHVYSFDGAPFFGGWPSSQPGQNIDRADCVAMVPTLTGKGYWLVSGSDGDVYSFGDAEWTGNYRADAWGPSGGIVGAFVHAMSSHPCGGITLVRGVDLATYHLAPEQVQ